MSFNQTSLLHTNRPTLKSQSFDALLPMPPHSPLITSLSSTPQNYGLKSDFKNKEVKKTRSSANAETARDADVEAHNLSL